MKKSILTAITAGLVGLICLPFTSLAEGNYNQDLHVGYWEGWGNVTFQQAVDANYNVIVLSFGKVDGTNVSYNEYGPYGTLGDLKKAIKETKENNPNIKFILSFGGANNTFNPNGENVKTVAQNMVNYVKELGIDGIDLDLEIHLTQDYLNNLCSNIKKTDPNILLTAAPQVNALNGNEISFVTSGHNADYKKAINSGYFDYLFLQFYNNNGFGVNDDGLITWNNENDMQGNSEFIYNCYKYLVNKYIETTSFDLHIPANTRICIGEPASKTETASWYSPYRHIINNKSTAVTTPEEEIWANMKDQYDRCKGDFSSKQYAGIMTWSINEDFKNSNSFGFAKTMFSGAPSYL